MNKLSFRVNGLKIVSHPGEPDALEVTVSMYEVGPCAAHGGRVTELDGWSVVVTCSEPHAHDRGCVDALMEPNMLRNDTGARSALIAMRAAALRAAARRERELQINRPLIEEQPVAPR